MKIGRGHKKATDEQVLEAYALYKSCRKAADALGMCPQSVHERLVRLGAAKPIREFEQEEIDQLRAEYDSHAATGTLAALAKRMGRTKAFLCRQAKELGLTDTARPKPYLSDAISIRQKRYLAENGHPRGSLGMKHTEAAKSKMSSAQLRRQSALTQDERSAIAIRGLKTRVTNGTHVRNRSDTSWKAGWREIGGVRKYYRSKWEANYAYYLEWLKTNKQIASWEHEPETFWFDGIKRGCVSYLPDFRVTELSGLVVYHEVKGWMDDRSKTKIKRMAKYHPTVKLIVIDSKGYNALKKSVQGLVPGWEP